MNLIINNNAKLFETLKKYLKKNNLNLVVNNFEDFFVNYETVEKELWQILAELCEIYGLKVIFDENTAIISKDEAYAVNYEMHSLFASRKLLNKTNVADNAKSFNNVSFESEENFFEELVKNLDLFRLQYENFHYVLHKQTGVLNVVATQKVQKIIAKYLNLLMQNLTKQVLVEAKILEVMLFDKHKNGINWNGLYAKSNLLIEKIKNFNIMNLSEIFVSMQDFFSFISEYGEIHTLANSCILLTHNTPGIFKAIEDKIFFEIQNEEINSLKSNVVVRQKNAKMISLPVGITIVFQLVSANKDNITIFFHPSVTDITTDVINPLIAKEMNSDHAKVPQTRLREMDTVLTLKDGETVVIGGLKYTKVVQKEMNKFWGFLGFENNEERQEVELVISVSAKIVKVDNEDMSTLCFGFSEL